MFLLHVVTEGLALVHWPGINEPDALLVQRQTEALDGALVPDTNDVLDKVNHALQIRPVVLGEAPVPACPLGPTAMLVVRQRLRCLPLVDHLQYQYDIRVCALLACE